VYVLVPLSVHGRCLGQALPMETRQLAAFRSLQQRTEAFEAALRSGGASWARPQRTPRLRRRPCGC